MITSQISLVSTLKHLSHATSCNLEFSYRPDVPVSYGEESITETNLLELRRRHSDIVHLQTFSKHQEAKVGADWEWYIVGRKRTLKMRVQAKRITSNDVLRIRHTVGQSGKQQHDLLIQSAQTDRMRPMYCIYSTEPQRNLWKGHHGCLLADAKNVSLQTRSLNSIEWMCWPWHYLFEAFPPISRIDYLIPGEGLEETASDFPFLQLPRWDAPRVLDLNEDTEWKYDHTGVEDTTPLDLARVAGDGAEKLWRTAGYDRDGQLDESARRTVTIDVRSVGLEHRISS